MYKTILIVVVIIISTMMYKIIEFERFFFSSLKKEVVIPKVVSDFKETLIEHENMIEQIKKRIGK